MKPQIAWLSIALFLGSLLWAAQDKGTGWLAPWAEQLGITLVKTPAPDEEFSELSGVVQDPERTRALLGEAVKDQKILLKFAGNVAWTVKTDSGTVRPCVVKATLEGSEKPVTLVPDYKTHLLKIGPPPFRGSTKARSGGK